MTVTQLRRRILDMTDDVCFAHNGRDCCINPHNDKCIDVGYNGVVTQCQSIDDVFTVPIFDGKPLRDICGEITLLK